jgi:hypothetical protein
MPRRSRQARLPYDSICLLYYIGVVNRRCVWKEGGGYPVEAGKPAFGPMVPAYDITPA